MSDLSIFLSNHPTFFKDAAGPIATIFAASVAGYIAWRLGSGQVAIARAQASIARDKLKFDLFELRYGIYAKAKELIEYAQTIHEYETIDHLHVRSLYVRLDEARFFFDADIIEFIKEVGETAEKRFGLLQDRYASYDQDEDAWTKQADQLAGTDIALRELYAEAPQTFESALRFDEFSGTRS